MATAILTAASYAPGGALTREYGIAKRVITLCASPLFTGLSMRECAQIASIASERFFERNQPLFMQGQPARHLMMIRAGSVKVSHRGPFANLHMHRICNGADDCPGLGIRQTSRLDS